MKFRPTPLPGVLVVTPEKHEDARGFFARTYCAGEFAAAAIDFTPVQANVSFNKKALTLRGMHFQAEPKPEPKLVRCTAGRMFDVAVDLRRSSPSFRRWYGQELDAGRHEALFIPQGCAHGFLTLEDDCEVLYLMGASYDPAMFDTPEMRRLRALPVGARRRA